MSSVFYSSKEEIRNRIVKRAQEIWGVDKAYDFDPIVVLMMEAISSEVFNISNDVKNLDNRVFDKFSRILASDNLVAPKPAHTIIHFDPIDQEQWLSNEVALTYKKKITSNSSSKEQNIHLTFSPLQATKMFKGKIKCMISPLSVFEVNGNQRKIVAKRNQSINQNSIYLGIDCQELNKEEVYKNLNFFFNWGNYQVSKEKYHLLSLSKWFLNGVSIRAFRDRFLPVVKESDTSIFERKQFMHQLQKDIEAIYSDRYLTLDETIDYSFFERLDKVNLEVNENMPIEVKDQFSSSLDWIRIDFPAAFTANDLDELMIQINAVPVVNKRLFQSKNRLKVLQNIIPVRTEEMEQMLTVHQIMDKDGVHYSEVPYENEIQSDDIGYYTVRSSGTERLDTRGAKEYIDYLFELLRDEKAAFSTYNADFLSNALHDLDKIMLLIHQKSKQKAEVIKEQFNYILLTPKNENDLVFLDVWLTYGEMANGISANEILQVSNHQIISNSPVVLLIGSKGGRKRLTRTESVDAFKYGLITADKIVTKNDIISFMKYELGEKLKRVEITNGVARSSSIQQALIKTVDITIEPDKNASLNSDEWSDLSDQLLSKLKVRSTLDQNYRIFIQ